jgi:hypothetical protein
MPETIYEAQWVYQMGLIGGGFAVIGFLLRFGLSRLERTLEKIWAEIKDSRDVEKFLTSEITGIKARCEERHNGRH